jgi:hypothetical protein
LKRPLNHSAMRGSIIAMSSCLLTFFVTLCIRLAF